MPNLSTVIICVVIFAVCVVSVISYLKKISGGCCGSGGGDIKIKPADTNKDHYAYKITVNIENMTCANCALRVENAFNKTGGCMAKVNLHKKCAEVWSKKELKEKEVEEIVARAGYEYKGMAREMNIEA